MELRYSGQFQRDIAHKDRKLSEEINVVLLNIKNASSLSQITNLVKLRKYQTHYRIKVADVYRIGIIVRGKTVWVTRFGHRNIFYKKLFP